ncbi:undecaprenyldiphospho-muramoylpentapeptide beta-N-acetylglucosaminyltransferase [Kocuria rhizophila]|uniref:undecaprenyldiphospho-muramoylpentapeptide beta-N-acetylglucosaminyltransferase n=1 Tax=Kocuria rhizophila TaxID=72000 RepID=UPI00223B3C3C|nr:undecaprenyldiphospho-muramoylpentapeptide beta-N-acetylglucosaminyltransferase [Kocuria rhizophila]MCT1956697.1 undecaprenyldiphospho-muramoylpentapeptide beta-N-acetylglucosaminyltransferase [Kocuria rhizophila]MCT2072640.1 undecaprenyldiphospho-muramoylpentapeptide beta-N-acetylglucosaminyltransferase [Kocuria rhizophila]
MTTTPGPGTEEQRAGSARVVLAGGGTAGHISPLLAIARAIQEARADATVCAVGTAAGMETRLVPEEGVQLELIERVPLPRRPSVDLVRLPRRMATAVAQAGRILDAQQATVVVGVGGYVCTPVYLAAARRRIPVVIHEANAKPGLANRVGARFASVVATAFPDTPLRGARVVGMPMREEIATLDRAAQKSRARVALGLQPDLPTVVVTGGSSGAQSMNRTVAAVAREVGEHGYQLLHVTGRTKEVRTPDGELLRARNYVQTEFVDGMESVYAAADLLVARAGAATVCEVAAVGLPAVFVPLPIGNGEQELNARSLVAAGGAQIVADDQFTPQFYRDTVAPLVSDAARLDRMARASAAHGVHDAAQVMARLTLDSARR